ncbi:MAG: hypothetical protein ACK55K_01695 [Bacteroidota bacterium]|jgi:hypothetical protein
MIRSTFDMSNKSRIQVKPNVMKKFSIVLLACFTAALVNAQEVSFRSNREKQSAKSSFFSKESARFAVRKNLINEVMSYRMNQEVNIQITPKTSFKGKVTAVTNDAPGLQTIILQSSETPGLVLSLSKIEIKGEDAIYRGVMISKNHSDLLLLEKDAVTGEYNWNKKEVAHMIPD